MALAAAPVAAVVVLVSVFMLGNSPVGPSSAAAALDRLAHLIASQPLTVHPGQYLYVDSTNDYSSFGADCQTFANRRRQIWIGADGSGLIRETTGPDQYTSAADRAACLRDDVQPRSGGTSNDWFAPQCLSTGPGNVDWSTISTDPQELLQQMRTLDGGPTTPGEDFVHVGDFLRETAAPPAVRAALYQAAALIPGVELLGTVRDHDGRPGLGIAYPGQGPDSTQGSSELIFDQQTGELQAEEASGPGGYWAVYQPEQVVDALPYPPPVPLTPACVNGEGVGKDVPGGSITIGASGS
jgi:RNA polymerase sigma-70 factor (ECF subfamily)